MQTTVARMARTPRGRRKLLKASSPAPKMTSKTPKNLSVDHPFIGWDGEGTSGPNGDKPAYVLFGNTATKPLVGKALGGRECLDLIVDTCMAYPDSYHVAFAFSYDVNMILRACMTDKSQPLPLHPNAIELIKMGKSVTWYPEGTKGRGYYMKYIPGKIFEVVRMEKFKDPKPKDKGKIEDAFSFFGTSFIVACEEYLGKNSIPKEVTSGKAKRNDFTYKDIKEIEKYWDLEGKLFVDLMVALKARLDAVGLHINKWYGPGAIANYLLKREGVQQYMNRDVGNAKLMRGVKEKVANRAEHCYTGGWFELFKRGRINGPLHLADINSAFPDGFAQVPDLATATWKFKRNPTSIKKFSMYYVRYNGAGRRVSSSCPHPLPWRDPVSGALAHPPQAEGWYWGVEVIAAQKYVQRAGGTFQIEKAWECTYTATRPFKFVEKMYADRQALKSAGKPEQIALKLGLNSIYGKTAQQTGHIISRGTHYIPQFHQIEWAGFATASCRAKILDACTQDPESIVAIQTDSVASTKKLNLDYGKGLGQWDYKMYDDALFLESGIYMLLKGGVWETIKHRGASGVKVRDAITGKLRDMKPADAIKFLQQRPKAIGAPDQPQLETYMNTFHAMGANLTNGTWCHWVTESRLVSPWRATNGRMHNKVLCRACKAGKRPSEALHDTTFGVLKALPSLKHQVAWRDGDDWTATEMHLDTLAIDKITSKGNIIEGYDQW